jgi:nucleoside 2-deoxyribosyltransferase
MKIYFAGPDVFRKDYGVVKERIKKLSRDHDIIPHIPGDGTSSDDPADIFKECLDLLRGADGVIANVNPFRSPVEPDSGTSFELGYAHATGKWIILYTEDQRDIKTKITGYPIGPIKGSEVCPDGTLVEDFGFPVNLMLAQPAAKITGSLKEAVEWSVRLFGKRQDSQ